MRKQEAIKVFGESASTMGAALGIGRSAVSQWPSDLTQRQTDEVVGAAVRLNLAHKLPPEYQSQLSEAAA